MKKIISPILIIFLISFIGYEHYNQALDNAKLLVYDPAEKVLNANLPNDEILYSFESNHYDKIYLYAGTEEKYGFRHILARHTENYFINFENKNNATMFDNNITGDDLILGIKDFYNHCVDVPPYNNRPDRNIVYIGFANIKDKDIKCLLVVRAKDNSIVTFYPLTEIRENELNEVIEEEQDDVDPFNRYYFD
jgi:hypothetical protein